MDWGILRLMGTIFLIMQGRITERQSLFVLKVFLSSLCKTGPFQERLRVACWAKKTVESYFQKIAICTLQQNPSFWEKIPSNQALAYYFFLLTNIHASAWGLEKPLALFCEKRNNLYIYHIAIILHLFFFF